MVTAPLTCSADRRHSRFSSPFRFDRMENRFSMYQTREVDCELDREQLGKNSESTTSRF